MTIDEMKKKKREYGYTYDQLAELSGVPKGTLQKIFSGKTTNPRYDTLRALEAALNIPAGMPQAQFSRQSSPTNEDTYNGYVPHFPSDCAAVREASFYESYTGKKQGEYTVEDYEKIPEEYRVELIDGILYDMAAPTTFHQLLAGEVYRQIANFIIEQGGDCIPFIAPTDVQLDCDEHTMLQPDVGIVCDPNRFTSKNVQGAPDFVLEVISPSSRRKDYYTKTVKYENAGVKEYWIVDPRSKIILVHFFESDTSPTIYPLDADVPVNIYQGKLVINVSRVLKWMSDDTL